MHSYPYNRIIKNQNTVLVVGAGGFIGSNVLKKLHSEGFLLRALDLFIPSELEKKADWVVGSSSDETLFAKAAQGCDAVIYLAGGSLPASGNANISAEINSHVREAVKSAEICRDLGIRKFIFASSGGAVYGSNMGYPLSEGDRTLPLNAYGVSKIAIENYLRVISNLYDICTVSLRLSNPYGEGQKASKSQGFIAAAMAAATHQTTLQIWGDGSVIRDFVHIEDVADAFLEACRYNGPATVVNIGSGTGTTLKSIVNLVETACKKNIYIEYNQYREIDVKYNVLDISYASSIFGWTPKISIEKGLLITAKWWTGIK